MPAIQGINPVTGNPVWVDCVSGDGLSESTAFVMRRSDPDAYSRLDTIATNTANVNSVLRDSWNYDAFVTSQAHRIVKTSAGRLNTFHFRNRNTTTTYFLMLFNRTTTPVANATDFLLCSIALYPGQAIAPGSTFFGPGMTFSSGIVYGISSNEDQYVAIATPADIRGFVGFV